MHWLAHSLDVFHATCDEWCLHWWEAIGTWFTGVATFAAVAVSLWLARRQNRPQLRLWADKQKLISGLPHGTASIRPADFPSKVVVEFANAGAIPVRVSGVWWALQMPAPLHWVRLKPRYALFQNPPEGWHQVPIELTPSQAVDWVLELDIVAANIAKLVGSSWVWRLKLQSVRVNAATSVGVIASGPLRRSLKADIRERVERARRDRARATPSEGD